MQALTFPRGNYYQIVCKAGDLALRIAQTDPEKFQKSRVNGAQPNPNDNGQLWMIEKMTQSDDSFEIVNCLSAFLCDQQGDQIRLRPGKGAKDQRFAVVASPVQAFHKYYWIKTDSKGGKALDFSGILRSQNFDSNKQSQLFRFQLVNNNTIQGSSLIFNQQSGKVLDVPAATRKKGERIVQWEANKRWNQRWQFARQGNAVAIQSLFNGLVLDIEGQSKKNGGKVVQWERAGSSNQLWIPEKVGNNLYKFRSNHESEGGPRYLAIKGGDVNDGGKLQVTWDDNGSLVWRVEGAQPL